MSTRANFLIKDNYSEQWFYRHSDGYPSGVSESLKEFVSMLNDGSIRDNVSQGGSWLILIGHNEYKNNGSLDHAFNKWKVGAYEVTDGQHGDIDYLYTIDLANKTVSIKRIYTKQVDTYTYDEFLKNDFSD